MKLMLGALAMPSVATGCDLIGPAEEGAQPCRDVRFRPLQRVTAFMDANNAVVIEK